MNSDIERYLCTTCGDHLFLQNTVPQEDGGLFKEELVCRNCGFRYPVINGIPRFVLAENYASSFGRQWNVHRRTQLDSYTGLPISRNRLFAVSNWPEHLKGEQILEAGSGAGRFTEVLLQTGANVFSFDYSSAVEANCNNNSAMPNLRLFQADIYHIPLPPCSFDKVICLGVLQHTPDPEGAFENLALYVKPGGMLVVDVYSSRSLSWLCWKYLLRPVTKRMNKEFLYKIIKLVVPNLIPSTRLLRKYFGRIGARLSPIVEYAHLGLTSDLNKDWAVLDTFDMYAPEHDHPQSLITVRTWFSKAGFANTVVQYGPNGIVARGVKPSGEGCRRH